MMLLKKTRHGLIITLQKSINHHETANVLPGISQRRKVDRDNRQGHANAASADEMEGKAVEEHDTQVRRIDTS